MSSPPDGLGGRPLDQLPAREPERVGAPRRVKGSLAPGCARPGPGPVAPMAARRAWRLYDRV